MDQGAEAAALGAPAFPRDLHDGHLLGSRDVRMGLDPFRRARRAHRGRSAAPPCLVALGLPRFVRRAGGEHDALIAHLEDPGLGESVGRAHPQLERGGVPPHHAVDSGLGRMNSRLHGTERPGHPLGP